MLEIQTQLQEKLCNICDAERITSGNLSAKKKAARGDQTLQKIWAKVRENNGIMVSASCLICDVIVT